MDNKYNYILNTTDAPYIQYWFAKKLSDIASSSVVGEGTDFEITSPTKRSLKEVVLKGDTTQETLSGKNLFGVGEISTKFCSATLTNGVLTVTPTGTGNPRINISLLTQLPAGNYVLNSETYLSKTTQIKNASETTLVGLSNNYKNVTFTLAETGAILSFNFLNAENTDPITIDLNTLQIESGSTATSYEPYCGGIPSPNPDYPQTVNTVTGDQTITITKGSDVQTYNLNLTGKNLLNPTTITNNYIMKWADSSLVSESGSITSEYINVNEGDSFSTNYSLAVFFFDDDNTYIGALNPQGTTPVKATGGYFESFTVPTGYSIKKIRVEYRKGQGDNPEDMTDKDIMLNTGTTALTYEPYYNYELCKISGYQDYIYKDGDKWYVKKSTNKIILDGSEDESWGVQNTGTASFFYRYRELADVGEIELQFYCNRATPTAISSNNTSEGAYIVTSSAATYHDFRVRYGTEMSVANWRTFLSTHNFILYYILATPTDTEITDETLLGQLNTILSDGYLSAGTNTVQTSATGLPIIINIKA